MDLIGIVYLVLGIVLLPALAFALVTLLLGRAASRWQLAAARALATAPGVVGTLVVTSALGYLATNGGPWEGMARVGAAVVLGLLVTAGIGVAARMIDRRDPATAVVG